MTAKDIREGLEGLGFSVAYRRFGEGDTPKTPFVVFYFPSTDNFGADGTVYKEVNELDIELYSDRKDIAAEQLISAWLTENNLFFEKQEYWIESEEWIQVIFEATCLGGI